MVSLLIEDAQLLRSIVPDDDPPVGQHLDAEDSLEEVGLLALHLPD